MLLHILYNIIMQSSDAQHFSTQPAILSQPSVFGLLCIGTLVM